MPGDIVAVVRWPWRVDVATIATTDAAIDRALSLSGIATLVFDLAEAEHLDSLGLGLLIDARNRATAVGVSIALHNVPTGTRQLLHTAGLGDEFPTHPEPSDDPPR